MIRWSVWIFCLLTLYLAFFFQLGNLPFVGADEPRYARIGEEMMESGDYLTPTLEGKPWLEKPPLLFWLESVSYRLFGVSEATARLPVALLALLCVAWMTYFAYRVAEAETAVLTMLILATSALFFGFARFAGTDMPLVSCFTMAVGAAYLAGRGAKPLGLAVLSGAALAAASLAKGPVALLLFGGVFVLFTLWRGRAPWSWRQLTAGGVIFIGLATPWFWLIWRETGFEFVATFWVNHHLARFLTTFHRHAQPFWYYLPVLLLGFFPWSFSVGSGIWRLWRLRRQLHDRQHSLDVFLWLWVLVPLLFFSISGSKLAGYILPVFPALALLAAREWKRSLAGDVLVFRWMRIQSALLVALTFVVATGLVFGGIFVYHNNWVGPMLAAPLLGGVLWSGYEQRRGRLRRSFLSLVAAITIFAALAFGVAAPILGAFHSAKRPASAVAALVSKEQPLIQFRYFHHTATYYSGYQATPYGIPHTTALFDYLLSHPQQSYYVLTKEHGWQIIEREIGCEVLMHHGNLYLLKLDLD